MNTQQAQQFAKFVIGLGLDPQALRRFRDDPEGEAEAAQLTEAEKTLLRSGSPAQIGEAILRGLREAGLVQEGEEPPLMVVHLVAVYESVAESQAAQIGRVERPISAQPERFTKFLLALGRDPESLRRFREDPDAEARAAGLTEAEKALVHGGDPVLIRRAIIDDLRKAGLDDPNQPPIINIGPPIVVVTDQVNQLSRLRAHGGRTGGSRGPDYSRRNRQMAERFTQLVLDLAENPNLLMRYQANPDRFLDESGLTHAERAVMQSGGCSPDPGRDRR
jgi:hypothetical protein